MAGLTAVVGVGSAEGSEERPVAPRRRSLELRWKDTWGLCLAEKGQEGDPGGSKSPCRSPEGEAVGCV